MNVRIGTPADRESLQRLIHEAFVVERFIKKGGGDRLDGAGQELNSLLSRGTFLVMDGDQSLAGCVYLEPNDDSCYLGLLSVSPDRQGEGLGRQLALASEAFARERGCRRIHLRVVSPRRDELVPLYRKLGYSERGTADYPAELAAEMHVPGYFILMTKELWLP
jgi:ribosomal protein S18 acetylase RimI-like enzyme